jgi:hypothetical protein
MMAFAPRTVQCMPDNFRRWPKIILHPLRIQKRDGCNAECIVTPSLISESPRFRYFERFSLRIKERVVREAINLSLARKRPDLSFGGVIASSASSFCADPRGCLKELKENDDLLGSPCWPERRSLLCGLLPP